MNATPSQGSSHPVLELMLLWIFNAAAWAEQNFTLQTLVLLLTGIYTGLRIFFLLRDRLRGGLAEED